MRRSHNPEVAGSSPVPAKLEAIREIWWLFCVTGIVWSHLQVLGEMANYLRDESNLVLGKRLLGNCHLLCHLGKPIWLQAV